MIKNLLSLLFCLFFVFSTTAAQAEKIEKDNQALYFIHFGRGTEEFPISLMDFYGFAIAAFIEFDTSGMTSITSHAYRTKDEMANSENTTIIEIVGSPEKIEQGIYTVSQRYCDAFPHQNPRVLVVKAPAVTTMMFE